MSNGITAGNTEGKIETREETRASERYVKPPVNIVESEEGLLLMADMPGASKDSLNVNMEKGILTINAPVSGDQPGRPVHVEFELAPYYRQFQVPDGLDHDRAQADFSNGVLTLRIPKAEAAKPRRIEVTVG